MTALTVGVVGASAGPDGRLYVSKESSTTKSHVRRRKDRLGQLLVLGIGRVLLNELRQSNRIVDLHTHVPQGQIFPQLTVYKLSTRFRFTLS